MPASVTNAQSADRGRAAYRRARAKWGTGWDQLTEYQRKAAISYELVVVMQAADDTLLDAHPPLRRLCETATAAFEMMDIHG